MFSVSLVNRTLHPVKYLHASCGVRYWEDSNVNGVEDTDGTLIPLRNGDRWEVTIDLETGKILDWPEGVIADIHYKICDDGVYSLLNENKNVVVKKEDYVVNMMTPTENGYGDYVIMHVDASGKINNWKVDFEDFEE